MSGKKHDPKNKPGGQPGDDERERLNRARTEESRDDEEEFPDLFEEKDNDFDDPEEREHI